MDDVKLRLAIMGRTALRGRPERLLAVSYVRMTGAESDVYECLFSIDLFR